MIVSLWLLWIMNSCFDFWVKRVKFTSVNTKLRNNA